METANLGWLKSCHSDICQSYRFFRNWTISSHGLKRALQYTHEKLVGRILPEIVDVNPKDLMLKPDLYESKNKSVEKVDGLIETGAKRGLCLIINNEYFEPDEDCESPWYSLKRQFQTLGYKVIVRNNLSRFDLLKLFKDLAERDHSQYDSFISCIFSHQRSGNLLCSDQEEVELKEIIGIFSTVHSPTLVDKPKIFFISGCQGFSFHPLSSNCGLETMKQGDFFTFCAETNGCVSKSAEKAGSYFVQSFCNLLAEYSGESISVERVAKLMKLNLRNQRLSDGESSHLNICNISTLCQDLLWEKKN